MAGPAPAIAAEDSNLFPSFLPTPFPLPLSQHKSCFPETQEKVRHLKRKNAELAVIAKRLEERARKLQEANLKVVSAGEGAVWQTSPTTGIENIEVGSPEIWFSKRQPLVPVS